MAIGNVQGFSEGFTRGFGLVNQMQQQKRRDELDRERLRVQEKQADELMKFRQQQAEDTAAYRAQTAADTAEYRAGMLDISKAREDRQAKQDQIQDETARLNAQLAADREKRLGAQAEVDAQDKASLRAQRDAQTQKTELETRQSKAAIILGQIYDIVKQPGRVSPEQISQFNDLVAQSSESLTGFNVAALTSNYAAETADVFPKLLERVAKGESFDLNAKEKNVMGTLFGVDGAQYVGKLVRNTDLMVNLPERLRDGRKLTIQSVGLHQVNLSKSPVEGETEPVITARLAVVVKDEETGAIIPYFPPLTAYRDPTTNKPVTLKLDEASQVAAAFTYMRRELGQDETFIARVRSALIANKYGTEEKYQQELRMQLKNYADIVAKGGNKDQFGIVAEGENLQTLTLQQNDLLRQRLEDKLLHGVSARPTSLDVDAWVEREAADIAAFPIRVQGKRTTVGEILPQLKDQTYDPNMITSLSTYFDGNKLMRGVSNNEFVKAVLEFKD